MILRYEILKHELSRSRFPHTPVLQAIYEHSRSACYSEFVLLLNKYFKEDMDKSLPMEDINDEIYAIVDIVKEKYPESFTAVGYYTKNMLALLYEEGRLTYDGIKVYPIELKIQELKRLEVLEAAKLVKEAAKRKEEEERLKEYRLYHKLREDTAESIEVGNIFRSWDTLFEAFKDCMPGCSNLLARKAIVREHIELSYTKGHWVVDKILIAGVGKRYTMGVRW